MWNIPIQKNRAEKRKWIDYKDSIYIIHVNKAGNYVQFQYDGGSCFQAQVKGLLFKRFKSKSKWFKPSQWNRKTVWSTDPNKVYFQVGNLVRQIFGKTKNQWQVFLNKSKWNKLSKVATQKAVPCDTILAAMLKEIRLKTGIEFELGFDDTAYGVNWYEAYVPLKYNRKKYFLTWSNCD